MTTAHTYITLQELRALLSGAPPDVVFQSAQAMEPALPTLGTPEDWRDNASALAWCNSRMVLTVCCALAPPLANITEEDSGGFHLRGASNSGKSTALVLADDLCKAVSGFMTERVPECTSGQVQRVARRFGLVAAAGELATRYGLMGWASGEASRAVAKCFSSWLDGFGGIGRVSVWGRRHSG